MVGERQIHTAMSVGATGRAELGRSPWGREVTDKGQGQAQAKGLASSLCGWGLLQNPGTPMVWPAMSSAPRSRTSRDWDGRAGVSPVPSCQAGTGQAKPSLQEKQNSSMALGVCQHCTLVTPSLGELCPQ